MRIPPFLFRMLSPAGASGKLSIFIFHRVLPKADPLLPFEPDAEQFDWMVRFIAQTYSVLTLGEAAIRLRAGTLPAATAVMTFDDGYADNLDIAWPILQRYGVVATFFIATSFLDGGRMWNDHVIETIRCLPDGELDLSEWELGTHLLGDSLSRVSCYESVLRTLKYVEHDRRAATAVEIAERLGCAGGPELMMTRDQVNALRVAGAEIGAHTHTHPILEGLDDTRAVAEIETGKVELEEILGESVHVFAFPNGAPSRDYSQRHADMVKRLGFSAAVSTAPGVASCSSESFHLPRFTPWDRTPLRFAARCLTQLWFAR